MWLTWWPGGYLGTPPPVLVGEPKRAARIGAAHVLSVARHPSASSQRLRLLISGLPWQVLRESWKSSSQALQVARTDDARLALVRLREALLDEMELSYPASFRRWYGVSPADR